MNPRRSAPTPRQLWILGTLALLWNSMGAFDYLMTETRNESYMAQFSPEQLDFFYGFPVWLVAMWAVAVWGGVLGAALLLLRRRLALPVFIVSFFAMLATSLRNYVFADGREMMGGSGAIFSLVIFAVSLALVFYARSLARRGVLV